MDGIRVITSRRSALLCPCSTCGVVGCPWDRIGSRPICPDCQEQMMLGHLAPLSEPLQARTCLLCRTLGVVCYTTFPLQKELCVELDLCSSHLQALIGRRLDGWTLQQVAGHLEVVGLSAKDIFLLHEAFYDKCGQALQPVPDLP